MVMKGTVIFRFLLAIVDNLGWLLNFLINLVIKSLLEIITILIIPFTILSENLNIIYNYRYIESVRRIEMLK